MKKLFLSTLTFFFGLGLFQAQDQESQEQTSEKISTYLSSSFPNEAIEKIDVNNDFEEMFQVKLSDGSSVNFNGDGRPTKIKSEKGIPEEDLPQGIGEYVSQHHAGENVVKYTKTETGHEVRLSNGTNLDFNQDQELSE